MHRAPSLLAVLASAVLYGLAFPPVARRELAWVCLVPLLVAVRRGSARSAVVLATVWTFAMAYAVGDCFPNAVSTYYDQPFVVGVGFFVGVSAILMTTYYAPFALFYRALAASAPFTRPPLAAAAWVAAEFARANLLGGHPWALLGYSQAGALPVVQAADVTGVYGVSFVLAAVNATLAELWLAVRDPRAQHAPRALVGIGTPAALAVLVLLGYGQLRLAAGVSLGAAPVRIGLVQGNLDLGSQWRADLYGQNLDTYLRLTWETFAGARDEGTAVTAAPPLVVWPENAMTFFVEDEPLYRRAIARILGPHGVELVAGGPRAVRDDTRRQRYYNAGFLLAPTGEVVARYDKQLLLPFAEYFPFGSVEVLRRNFARVREFTPGGVATLLPTAAGRAGVVICNEVMYPPMTRARVRAGADFLLNLANDTWLGDPKYSLKMFEISALRAVEHRRYLVRSSTSGPSAIVDPLGRVVLRTDPFTAGAVVGELARVSTTTLYTRVGDVFAWLCVAVAVAAAARLRRFGAPRARQGIGDAAD